jgi:hypothetical protein
MDAKYPDSLMRWMAGKAVVRSGPAIKRLAKGYSSFINNLISGIDSLEICALLAKLASIQLKIMSGMSENFPFRLRI